MEQTINKAEVLGRVGNEPRISQTEEGRRVIRFSIATSEFIRQLNGDLREETTWHRIVAWEGKENNHFDLIKKGLRVRAKGRIRTNSYEKDGQQKYSQEILAQSLQIEDSES